MKAAKSTYIIYWVATVIIFLFEGVMPALTGNSEMAVAAIRGLGYPDYFRIMLNGFKIAGALVLVLPVGNRLKEWAYAGFAFSLVAASISIWAVNGFGGEVLFPMVILAILAVSYFLHHRIAAAKQQGIQGRQRGLAGLSVSH